MSKLTLPDVVIRFQVYHAFHPDWGVLHVVLADGNHQDHFVEGCIELAREHRDDRGLELAHLLLRLSRTQRGKLARIGRSDYDDET